MVVMETDTVINSAESQFLAEGLEAIKLCFRHDLDSEETISDHPPEFVHQHFGENETIFGYRNLEVTINYTDASMMVYPEVNYEQDITSIDKQMKPDDIILKLKDQLPADQMNMMVESKHEFQAQLIKQKRFKPFGEVIAKFTSGEKSMELYKISESSVEFDKYLARVQTLALWYIDAAQYTDNTDPRWVHYFLFESRPGSEGDGGREYSLAGYASLYRFYAYQNGVRPRVAQIMLLPQYRGFGNGAKLLQSVYKDLWTDSAVVDITAEDPAANFISLRDYVDCLNCQTLAEFAPEQLVKGFSDGMKDAARDKYKISRLQARRVYEILRLKSIDQKNAAQLKEYRIDIKRRIERPMKNNDKDWKKILTQVDPEELEQASTGQFDPEQRMLLLQTLYDELVETYKNTIDRMRMYPSIL